MDVVSCKFNKGRTFFNKETTKDILWVLCPQEGALPFALLGEKVRFWSL